MDEGHVIGVRDPNGFRPLCLGKLDNGWVLASESPALDVVGAHLVRELEPGEMIVIDATGYRAVRVFEQALVDPKLCLFEFVYFARPDTRLYGQSVHQARVRMGEQLAEQAPVEADLVMGVPESGIPAAEGYARKSGIPFGQGLVKNRYIGRTFIAPNQEMRALGVRMKLNPLRDNIAGLPGPVYYHEGSDGAWFAVVALFPASGSGVLAVTNGGRDMGGQALTLAAAMNAAKLLAKKK
jgi:amidophosphoribosyltransferase